MRMGMGAGSVVVCFWLWGVLKKDCRCLLTRKTKPVPLFLLRQEVGDVFAEGEEFSDDAGGDVGIVGIGEEQNRLNTGEPVVHGGDVALIFKVLDGTQAAHNELCSFAAHEVDGQVVVAHDFHARLILVEVADELYSLLGAKEGTFVFVESHADDDAVKHGQGAFHKVGMSDREGVEGAGENGCFHC